MSTYSSKFLWHNIFVNFVINLQHGMGSYAKPMERQELVSFLSGGGGRKLLTFSNVIFYPCILH